MHVIARMNVGGPAVEIVELVRGLNPDDISQRLVTGFCGDDEADFLESQAFDIFATRVEGLGRHLRPTDDAKALATLVRIIRSSRPDIVHTHTTKAGVLGRIAAKVSGTEAKVIHTYHGHLLHGYFSPSLTRALVQVERQLAAITDRIITVGNITRDELLRAGIGFPDQYTVIRTGVKLGPLPDKEAARRELGLPDGSVVVSMIGRLTNIKRPDRFADVVSMIKDRGMDAHFLVAGGGDYEQRLLKRVDRERLPVSMLGWRSDIERLLVATDILLLTSDNEGIPLSIIQAASVGVPSVATSVGGVPEVLEHRVSGLLADCSAAAIAKELESLISDQDLRKRLGREAKARVQTGFNHATFLALHAQVYGSTVKAATMTSGTAGVQ